MMARDFLSGFFRSRAETLVSRKQRTIVLPLDPREFFFPLPSFLEQRTYVQQYASSTLIFRVSRSRLGDAKCVQRRMKRKEKKRKEKKRREREKRKERKERSKRWKDARDGASNFSSLRKVEIQFEKSNNAGPIRRKMRQSPEHPRSVLSAVGLDTMRPIGGPGDFYNIRATFFARSRSPFFSTLLGVQPPCVRDCPEATARQTTTFFFCFLCSLTFSSFFFFFNLHPLPPFLSARRGGLRARAPKLSVIVALHGDLHSPSREATTRLSLICPLVPSLFSHGVGPRREGREGG